MSAADDTSNDEILLADLFQPLVGRGRRIWQGTLVATVLAAVIGTIVFLKLPVTRTSMMQFRPVFEGADEGKYPNGLPFAPSDIVSVSVLDETYKANGIERFCPRDAFLSGWVVLENSADMQFLNLEYQARLSDTRLTGVERQRFQDEYTARRSSLRKQYELTFVQPKACSTLSSPVVFKSMSDVLEKWASQSEERRGVLKMRVAVLSPAIFDQPGVGIENLLVRADLLRTAVSRVIANIRELELLPGAALVRGSEKKISLPEVRAELEDLIQAQLDPLVAQAGRGLGRQAVRWLEQSLQTATIRLKAAEQRVEAYRTALREYSGTPAAPTSTVESGQKGSDVQALTPQIDRTFIDRIVELSASNTAFRQEITRKAIEASVEAVNRAATVEQYRQLSALIARDTATDLTPAEVSALLNKVAQQAKDATRRFNEISDEFSRVSLRVAPHMFEVERPAETVAVRSFGLRSLILLVAAVAIGTPILLALLVMLQHQLHRLRRSGHHV